VVWRRVGTLASPFLVLACGMGDACVALSVAPVYWWNPPVSCGTIISKDKSKDIYENFLFFMIFNIILRASVGAHLSCPSPIDRPSLDFPQSR
jgi:hypothetical protein